MKDKIKKYEMQVKKEKEEDKKMIATLKSKN